MKKKFLGLVMASMAAAIFFSAPVFAAKLAVSDDTLEAISGAANNTWFAGGASDSTITASNANGNIQAGSYQWADNHVADGSVNKGGNIQSGDNSHVQQYVTASTNALAWGTVAQSVTTNTNSNIAGNQTTQAYAVMFLGGF
jgi:hypothetical protein